MPLNLKFNPSQVVTEIEEIPAAPVVRFGTTLLELAQLFARLEVRHALVQDADGRLAGVVSTTHLQQAMRDLDDTLVPAWHSRTVESLLHVSLADVPSTKAVSMTPGVQRDMDCVSVREGSSLVALMTNDDVLFSWNRLEPTLARAALDALTQLPNRAHFERRFQTEWQRAARLGLSLGVIIVDVDHFKEINDGFGHLQGDLVLASVARCCQSYLRSYDLVARFAGDEFIALTCGCNAEDIDLPIRRLQSATRELSLRVGDQSVTVSLSIGASVICESLDQLQPRDLLDAADKCLYLAKQQGRNRAFRSELHADGSLTQATRVDADCAQIFA
jgi:diguanylate cyclase (GGDEF)-like protein